VASPAIEPSRSPGHRQRTSRSSEIPAGVQSPHRAASCRADLLLGLIRFRPLSTDLPQLKHTVPLYVGR
jgi:hypothetical protein